MARIPPQPDPPHLRHIPAICSRSTPCAAELQQRLHRRVLAAEIAVQGRQLHAVATREDLVAELLAVGGGQATVLGEPLVGVMVEHFGPEVGVVAGRVATAPDVVEVGGAVTRRHLRQVDLELLQRAGFKGAHILQRRVGQQRVPG
ncbi:hypothetical protein G6F57_013087 [Rhizopus arrhizus]|nr:hypothetical protein G6F57_013087 [Rhizopus arrhizus]